MNKLFALAILSLVSAFAGCRESPSLALVEQPIPVHTVAIAHASQGASIQVAGVIKPRLETDLASQIIAPVSVITKREGERFRRGDVLVRFHAPALDANVTQANAALSSAEKQQVVAASQEKLAADTFRRYAQLRERHSVTPYELDQVQAQMSTARAQEQGAEAQVVAARSMLAAQRANASDAVIYAPFDGVVTKRMADPGAMATPGLPLLHVQSVDEYQVEFSAPEDLMRSLQLGTVVSIALDGSSFIQARIATISRAGEAGSHLFPVKAALPTSVRWNTGTVVQVFLPTDPEVTRIVVPSQAIVQQGGLDAVLVVTPDNRAQVRYVTLGASPAAGQAEVLSGLWAGDRMLSQGDLGLAGRKIEVQP